MRGTILSDTWPRISDSSYTWVKTLVLQSVDHCLSLLFPNDWEGLVEGPLVFPSAAVIRDLGRMVSAQANLAVLHVLPNLGKPKLT